MSLLEKQVVRGRTTYGMPLHERLVAYREKLIRASNRITQRRPLEINRAKLARITEEIRRISRVVGPRR